jgi:hypothetical protein
MKRGLILIIVMIVTAPGLLTRVYPQAVSPVQPAGQNRAISSFESSRPGCPPLRPMQENRWNRYGSGFELSSVRTITQVKASVQKYWWHRAGSELEMTGMPAAPPDSDHQKQEDTMIHRKLWQQIMATILSAIQ